jgi:hypothetical protein
MQYKAYAINRFLFIRTLTGDGVPADHIILQGLSLPQIMQRIADKENILRTTYRWTGPFCITYRHKIRDTKIQTDKDLAYLRIPADLLHQRHLLSDWFLHFRNCCNGAMQDAGSARRFTEDNMYNVMFIETIVAPALVEGWNLIRNTTKDHRHL